MNGKKAKFLRSLAEAKTIGKPKKQYGFMDTKFGKSAPPGTRKTGCIHSSGNHLPVILTDCTREAYQQLKKVYRFGS